MDSAVQKVKAGDTLKSLMQLVFTTDTVGDNEIVVMVGKVVCAGK
jgi:hypothetical protein